METSNKSAVCTGELPGCADNSKKNISTTLLGQSGEKYFDYFVFSIVDCGINSGLPRSGARHRALAQTIGNARGLDINSPLSTVAHTEDLRHRHQQHSQTTRRS
jgi:hypothetical protein